MTKHRHSRHDYLPAAQYDALLPAHDLASRLMGIGRVHRALLRRAEISDGHRVLEIGSGTGNLAILARRDHPGAEVTGIDPDPKALCRAEQKINGDNHLRFDRGYAQNLPYADGTFDRVLSSLMLHHLPEEAKSAALAEVHRVLRPGGRLHLVDIDNHIDEHDGRVARFFAHRRHGAAHFGGPIPQLLTTSGLVRGGVDTRHHRMLGRLVFITAVRPSSSGHESSADA